MELKFFPKNNVWFNRAFVYYYKYKGNDTFRGEFLFIMKAIGLIKPYVSNLNKEDKNI